jgi:hypothetical protein
MATTTETLTSAAERVDRAPAISRSPQPRSDETLLDTTAYVLRTLGGVALALVVVWMIVMAFTHLPTIAFASAGVLAGIGVVELIRRNRRLAR